MSTKYLGDGVYVEFDGYHVVLKANSRISPTDTIYLDPSVIDALMDYIDDLIKEKDEEREA